MFVYDGKIYTRLCVPVVTCPALDLPTAHATGTLLASSSAFSLAETANKEFASAASVMEKPVVFLLWLLAATGALFGFLWLS